MKSMGFMYQRPSKLKFILKFKGRDLWVSCGLGIGCSKSLSKGDWFILVSLLELVIKVFTEIPETCPS